MIAFPRRGPRAREYRAFAAVAAALRARCDPRWRYTYVGDRMLRAAADVSEWRLERIQLNRGWPDYMLVGPGKVCFLKLKPPRKIETQHGEIAAHLMACGCGYAFAMNADDAIDMLTDWGVLLPEAPRNPEKNHEPI